MIRRYKLVTKDLSKKPGVMPCANGRWIKWADHEAEMAALQKKLDDAVELSLRYMERVKPAPHPVVGEDGAKPVAWMDATDPEKPQTIPAWAKDSDAFGKVVDRAYTIPLYLHPSAPPVVGDAALREAARCALGHLTGNMDGDMDLGDPVVMLRAALSPSRTTNYKDQG